MTLDTLSRPESPPDEPPAAPEQHRDVSLREVAAWVYRFFYSKRVGLVLILAMSLMAVFGALFQQAPDGVASDPQAYESWLRQVRPMYGGWTPILSAIGMFGVFSSWWFRATTILLAISILACTIHRLPRLWQAATTPHVHVREPFFDNARLNASVDLDLPQAEAMERVADELRRRRYRVLPDGHGTGFYADRNRWFPFGTAIAHLAFIIILLGVFTSSVAGFNNDNFTVAVGTKAEVGHGTGMTIEALSFNASYYEDGRPRDYVSELVLHSGGVEVKRQEVRVNTPLRHDGVAFYQAFFGIAADLTVTDPTGAKVYEGSVPLQYQTDDKQNMYGRLLLGDRSLEVYVIGAASGARSTDIGPGQMVVEVYPSTADKPLGSARLDQGKPGTVGDLTYTFGRERAFTGLMVARDPGAMLVWIGSFLIVVGTTMTMAVRHRRLWVRIKGSGAGSTVRLASPDRPDSTFTTAFRGIAESLKETDRA